MDFQEPLDRQVRGVLRELLVPLDNPVGLEQWEDLDQWEKRGSLERRVPLDQQARMGIRDQ